MIWMLHLVYWYSESRKQIRSLNFQPAKSSSQNTQIHWCFFRIKFFFTHMLGYLNTSILVILHCPRKIAIIGPWLFRVYRGWTTTQLCGDYIINHDIRIPFLPTRIQWNVGFQGFLTLELWGKPYWQRGWPQVVTESFFFRWVAQHPLTFVRVAHYVYTSTLQGVPIKPQSMVNWHLLGTI